MTLLDCGHEPDGSTHQVCVHIRNNLLEKKRISYTKVFTGQGCIYFLACKDCKNVDPMNDIPWQTVCDSCFQKLVADHRFWSGIRGVPEIAIEPAPLAFAHRYMTRLPDDIGAIRSIQPIPSSADAEWIAFTISGALLTINTNTETYRLIGATLPSDFDFTVPMSLTCSSEGSFLCLTQTLGDHGVVIDTRSGECPLRLKRDGYQTDVTPFPAAFVVHDKRTFLVHATEWKRLDISDPTTGELLTERTLPIYEQGKPLPPHYLDYFHGQLLVSPDQKSIVDNGWGWHPYGLVRAWNMEKWITDTVWESEDGPSLQEFAFRNYFWGAPMCWIDNQTLAIWGYGEDSKELLPAAWLFDVASGKERGWFPGPDVVGEAGIASLEHLADFGGRFFFDRYLFAISELTGVGVWSIERGARLHIDPSFAPVAYHPVTKEFLTILENGNLQLSRLVEE